jgi:DNA-directed RNA polymerase specialized sigma24 family protein
LLAKLPSEEAQAGWEEILLQYGPALYQTARTLARDGDDVADCFVHICEQLAKDRYGDC